MTVYINTLMVIYAAGLNRNNTRYNNNSHSLWVTSMTKLYIIIKMIIIDN